jgi:phosphate uptake regulator
MIRKLIQLSPSTSVVSMPSSWIKDNGVSKGDSLDVSLDDNKVIISKFSSSKKKEIHIDISDLSEKLVWIAIDQAYTSGNDSIFVKTNGFKQSSLMSEVAPLFPGMVIIDMKKDFVHLQSMDDNSANLDDIISRIFNLNVSLIEESIDSVKSRDWDSLSRVKNRDWTINSYVSYSFRILNKNNFSPHSKIGSIHTFIKLLELLSDKLCILFESVASEKFSSNTDAFSCILDLYRDIRRSFQKYSVNNIKIIESNYLKLLDHNKNIPKSLSGHVHDIAELFIALAETEVELKS